MFGLGAAMENLWLTTAELGMPVFDHAGVEQRHFCVPADWFDGAHSFGDRNDLYVQHALALSIEAARRALVVPVSQLAHVPGRRLVEGELRVDEPVRRRCRCCRRRGRSRQARSPAARR